MNKLFLGLFYFAIAVLLLVTGAFYLALGSYLKAFLCYGAMIIACRASHSEFKGVHKRNFKEMKSL